MSGEENERQVLALEGRGRQATWGRRAAQMSAAFVSIPGRPNSPE